MNRQGIFVLITNNALKWGHLPYFNRTVAAIVLLGTNLCGPFKSSIYQIRYQIGPSNSYHSYNASLIVILSGFHKSIDHNG